MPRSVLKERARALRAHDTRAEAKLWEVLRGRRLGSWKWRRQVPVGPYVVDFFCAAQRLVVEVDGATHDDVTYDRRRTAFLEQRNLRVLRVQNHGIYEDRAAICDGILAACGGEAPHPTLSPRGGERGR
jgi:very-short-patch-repair endonuclease